VSWQRNPTEDQILVAESLTERNQQVNYRGVEQLTNPEMM
jgi:hypothetical protein